MSTRQLSDPVKDLPIDKKATVGPSDLEFLHNLLQPANKDIVMKAVSPFITAFAGALLFAFLGLPIWEKMTMGITKGNWIYSKAILFLVFLVAFWIIDKMFLKS